jgi:hypothetical protein
MSENSQFTDEYWENKFKEGKIGLINISPENLVKGNRITVIWKDLDGSVYTFQRMDNDADRDLSEIARHIKTIKLNKDNQKANK